MLSGWGCPLKRLKVRQAMIDLTEIPSDDGFAFERFAEDLLRALGWTVIVGAGKGADGAGTSSPPSGRQARPAARAEVRFPVQCKHYAGSGRSVGGSELSECFLMPAKHGCQGWLLVTSSQLSANATLQMEAARKAVPGTDFDAWDADALRAHLRRDECRKGLAQHLPRSCARCANILTPQPAEVREVIGSWLAAGRTARGGSRPSWTLTIDCLPWRPAGA
jgi:hypothetical protein